MIVSLTWSQVQAARQWGTARHKQLLASHRTRGKKFHECAMPAIAWRTLADRLMCQAYHPSGNRRYTHLKREGSLPTLTTLTAIERALAGMHAHPAVQKQAVEGHSGDVIVAWYLNADRWSIYPNESPMKVLIPVADIRQFGKFTMAITRWEARDSLDLDLPEVFLDPLDHAGWQTDTIEESVTAAVPGGEEQVGDE